ncbi:ribbon-helix-helix domain-containing protein [Maricaulis sp.]|uniref:ribbon-helix-helix domain-containing protein n=1 Tax=Maricaulis sp. TaxID=1486257 RepID=UPI002B278538|nr:ribbon-helix-helix domain-containing protein [Maricaulis sp.]
MLEIRLSLPLKEALSEHCRTTGVSRSAFVRAAITDRIERERQALSHWLAPAGDVAAFVRSRYRVIGGAFCVLLMSYFSALAVRPDASAMLVMLEMAEMVDEGPVAADASAPQSDISGSLEVQQKG